MRSLHLIRWLQNKARSIGAVVAGAAVWLLTSARSNAAYTRSIVVFLRMAASFISHLFLDVCNYLLIITLLAAMAKVSDSKVIGWMYYLAPWALVLYIGGELLDWTVGVSIEKENRVITFLAFALFAVGVSLLFRTLLPAIDVVVDVSLKMAEKH